MLKKDPFTFSWINSPNRVRFAAEQGPIRHQGTPRPDVNSHQERGSGTAENLQKSYKIEIPQSLICLKILVGAPAHLSFLLELSTVHLASPQGRDYGTLMCVYNVTYNN